MTFNFFASLSNKQPEKSKHTLPNTPFIVALKDIATENNLAFFKNITIYHHNQSIFIPLLIVDEKRGIYLFQYKDWSFDMLKKASIEQASFTSPSKNTLSYDGIKKFITTKYNEILHNDGVEIFNFLLTENLSFEEYENLPFDVQVFFPYEKILFHNSSKEEIISKLNEVSPEKEDIPSSEHILANLFTQYLILGDAKKINLATQEQIHIIENRDYDLEVIYGHAHSGKTTTLMLKALLLKLQNPSTSVCIIKPTVLSCDKFKAQLLALIEYAIIDVDITSLLVLTPSEFESLKKVSTYILCDDANLLEHEFIEYLYEKTSKSHLSIVNPKDKHEHSFKLTTNFQDEKTKVEFREANPIANAMQLISNYANSEDLQSILCISNNLTKTKLHEDLQYFIKDDIHLLDSTKNLIDQDQGNITLSDYEHIHTLQADIVILLDIDEISEDALAYAINLANKIVYIIYEQEYDKITNLKKIFQ